METVWFTMLPMLGFLLSLIPIVIAIYLIVMWVTLSKERNKYLKQILEELQRK